MKKFFLFIFFLLFYYFQSMAQKVSLASVYHEAWKALDNNDFTKARTLLLQAEKSPRLYDDAFSSLIILDTYLGHEARDIGNDRLPFLQMTDPEYYFFSFWFNQACLGNYGKLDSAQLKYIDFILSHRDLFNGSMQAAAHYFKSLHEVVTWNTDQWHRETDSMGAITDWEVTGPFENTGGSGFDKDYDPITHPEANTLFKSFNNTGVPWFVPAHLDHAGWIFVKSCFPDLNGLMYAQCFVKADQDKDCILCLGGAGSLKVWVNDKLLISQPEEKITELDTYKAVCHLNKGYNRVLVQLGYADIQLPNFIVRFTDEALHPVSGLTADPAYHPYTQDISGQKVKEIPHFAEVFFKNKIDQDPANPVNYLLLAQVYLRNQKGYLAQKLLLPLLSAHPNNVVLLFQYSLCLKTEANETERQEYLEKIKSLDPEGFLSQFSKVSGLRDNKNYTAALGAMDRVDSLIGSDPGLLMERIKITANTGDLQRLFALIKKGMESFPDEAYFPLVAYNYYKESASDPSEALKVLEDYNARLFNYQVMNNLADEYIAQGQFEKGIALLKKLSRLHPESRKILNTIVLKYYQQNKPDSAIRYLTEVTANAPYTAEPYPDLAACYLQKGDTAGAVNCLHKALELYPALSSARMQLRELTKKPELTTYFPKMNADKLITDGLANPYDSLHHFYYIFDVCNTLIYARGASEQEFKKAVYLRDSKGVDLFKDVSIPYNNNFQELTILKAEMVKPDGSKVPAEINDNEMVFPQIEPRDVVYFNYKIRNNGVGRMGREFWDKYYFSADVPAGIVQYNVLVADDLPFYYKISGQNAIRPVVSSHEGFKLYSWEMEHAPALKDEYLMPSSTDIGNVLHVSTISSWNTIASWYSDLTREQSAGGFETEQLIGELFPHGYQGMSDMDKARIIYNYIVPRITYSSVDFLQSAYVPQKAGKTLISRLGDCKDIATLFVSLARKVGVNANLVLVNTRDNGQHAMELPSLEFNHCIAKFTTAGKDYYIEPTDQNLPFLALPGNLNGAQALNIPFEDRNDNVQLTLLQPGNKLNDEVDRKVAVSISDDDLTAYSDLWLTGVVGSDSRSQYKNELESEVRESLKQQLTGIFNKPVEVQEVKLSGLNRLSDSIHEQIGFKVSNEVIKVGEMNIWKPNFMDIVANSNLFTVKERKYPIEYWQYENADHYQTVLEVNIPPGRAFKDIPADEEYHFNQMHYRLTYQKMSPHKIVIRRTFSTTPWEDIPAKDYAGLEDFFHKIMNAEARYISF